MDDARDRVVEVGEMVRVLERIEHVTEHVELHAEREALRLLANHAGEALALQVVHDDEGALAVRADLVGRHDVRMTEARGEASLFEEHVEEVAVDDELRLQLLDHEELAESGGAVGNGEIDDAHATARDLGDELIFSEALHAWDGSRSRP